MKKLALLSTLLLTASSISFAASLSPMNKMQAQKVFSDKTITTIAAATLNDKLIANPFTGYFSKDGKASGKFADKPDNGPQADTGTWMVKSNGMFCMTWEHWFDGKEKCLTFYKLSNGVLITNTAKGFESLVLDDQIQSGNQM